MVAGIRAEEFRGNFGDMDRWNILPWLSSLTDQLLSLDWAGHGGTWQNLAPPASMSRSSPEIQKTSGPVRKPSASPALKSHPDL